MISLFENIKLGLRRANEFKLYLSILFLSTSYIFISEARQYVVEGMVYAILPEIIKLVNCRITKKDKTNILSYKSICIEYTNKLVDYGCYSGLIENYNNMYNHVPIQLSFFMYLWRAFIEMHRFRYYCEVIIGTVLIISTVLFYPFLKYYYKQLEVIINNLRTIPISVYRNVYNSIIGGQSIHIEIDNIVIISVPPKNKDYITEDELERIAPKKMPTIQTILTRKMKIELNNCAICQEIINTTKEMSRCLPKCKHSFHCHCIDNWFFSGHETCPICRDQIN
jgi:hypothetical protein